MKILLANPLGSEAEAAFAEIGAAATLLPDGLELVDAVPGYDVLVVRSARVGADVVDAADRLGLIVRAGAGFDSIDIEAAAARGIFVCNVPGRNAIAVAELTLGLMLAIDRSIVEGAVDLRNGRWDKARYRHAEGLAGKTLAIVGLGAIGLEVAQRARAFDMTVTALRKAGRDPERERMLRSLGIRLIDSDDELLGRADIVSVHVPGGPSTERLVDAAFLDRLRDGAVLINTSRGSTIDESALLEAIDRKGLRVGLDVFPSEPAEGSAGFDSALARHPSVIGSHHIGASTAQAQRSIVEGTVEVIDAYRSGSLVNCVNLQAPVARIATLIVRHIDQVGVLAEVLAILRSHNLNVQEMTNRVFADAEAAVASIELSGLPDGQVLAAINALEPVLGVQLQEHA